MQAPIEERIHIRLDRLLSIANAARSRSFYSELDAGSRTPSGSRSESHRPRQRRLRSPEQVEELLTRDFRRTALKELCECLDLERCAIVLPLNGKDGFWALVDQVGLPAEITKKSFYSLGDGLTGRVLQNSLIVSADILRDNRRSAKYGNVWMLGDERESSAPRAYVGAPLWVQLTDASQDAIGAIYGIREAQPFSDSEIGAFELGAQLLSLGHDRLRSWRRRSETDLRQLHLSHLWELPLRESEKYVEVLRALKAEFPFSRLLLSLVDRDSASMRGVAALGFRDDLVAETIRPVGNVKPEEEDILAWVHRARITLPQIVRPTDTEWKKVHQITAFRHQVHNPLLLMPMMGTSGVLVGVVLAECPDARFRLSPHEMRRISLFVNHAGNLIENHRRATRDRALSGVWGRLHTSIFEDTSGDAEDIYHRLGTVITESCRHIGLTTAVLYEVRDGGTALKGIGGYGLDLDAVLQHHVSLQPAAVTSQNEHFLLRCYRSREPISESIDFVEKDTSILPRLKSTSCFFITGLRVMAAKRCVGIFVTTHEANGTTCSLSSMARIKSFLSAMGHLIESAQLKEEMNASKRSASAYHSLALAISEIGKPNSRYETVGDGIPFSSVLRDVANLFDSSLSQLFLCEPREITKGRGFEIARHVIGTSLRENTRFLEPTHKERFPKRLLAQKLTAPRVIVVDTGTGLTASAVKTLKPVTSPNVSDDPFWSGTELELTGLRAFMGLPLYFETDDQIVVYGVLTLTRLRYRQGDSRDFSVEEVQTGQNIAALLTSAFRQRHEFQRITDAADEVTLRVKRCLRWFRHDIPAMVSDIEDEARACRALARGRKSERLLDLAVLSEATRSVFVACALALGERADKHADGSANHVLEIKQMKEQLDALLRRDSKRGDTSVEINVVPTNVVRVFGVLEKPLMYCAFALLQNGVVACYHNRVHTSGQHPGRVILTLDFSLSDTLKLTVLDDAGGVGEHTLDELTIEQKSGWPSMPTGRGQSTGMGLYIVKRLVGEHLNGMLQVQNKEWGGRTGALFTVTVPYTSLE